jgi:hypothetical protein
MTASLGSALSQRIQELATQLATATEEVNGAIARQSELISRFCELITIKQQFVSEHRNILPDGLPGGPRGPRIIAVLKWLVEAGDRGLSPSEIATIAEKRGVLLNASSTRSQLSRAVRNGWVRRRHGRYYTSSSVNTSDEASPPNPA